MDMKRSLTSLAAMAVIGGGVPATVPTSEAQYFGRNRVQYQGFDFSVLKTEHFDIYYYPEEEVAVEYAALMAERWYARLSRLISHELTNRQPLILYASSPQFRQTNTIQGDVGEATGGVTEILKRRIVLPFAGPLKETDHVLGHELVHAFQFDITGEGGGIALAGIPSVLRFPLWFVEGMAEYLSVGPEDSHTAMWMRDAARTELPSIRKLNDPRFFPYRYGQSLWAYVAGRWGDDAVGRILKASRTSGTPEIAIRRVLRVSPDTLVQDWHEALRAKYTPVAEVTSAPSDYGRPLITAKAEGGRINLAPALSPDGQYIVFLSERDLFSIDMFLAETSTGKVIRKIVKTAVNPHFESLQFISSAGSWDFEGKRFVFTAIRKGRPVLTILDMERNRTEREIPLPELGEAFNPTWSPDGRYIVFSGLIGGLSDLYVYDLQESGLRRMTNDPYADLQPAWSPDGTTIAFVTDRFGTRLSSLIYGEYRLALMDPATGNVRELLAFDRGKHINPQWSPDGESLYFVSDQNGASNVYNIVVATGERFQLTNLYTGVSGITALSPTLSVAVGTGTIAMSVYLEDVYPIYLIDDQQVLAGGPVQPPFEQNVAVLPPERRMTDDVPALLANAFFGLPPRDELETFELADYHPRLRLDYIGQPSLAVGADRFGTFIAGGGSLFWSDMLGNHNLATALQIQGSFKQIAALVGYTNLANRLNWGLSVQQIPFVTGFVDFAFGTVQGVDVLQERTIIYRQINRQAGGIFAYPLSGVQRLEWSANITNVSYDVEEKIRWFTLASGQQLIDSTASAPSCADTSLFGLSFCTPTSLNFAQASAALVYDNSLWGVASPLLGQRYRLEVGSLLGSLNIITALADYRKYFMPVRPFTLAFRVLHFGRYGPDADNTANLSRLFLGYDGLVRGYNISSFDFLRECPQDFSQGCDAFDQLFGSRMIVGNAELRFPPLGLLGIGSGLFGFLPIEMAIFADAGLAYFGNNLEPGVDLQATPQDERAFFLGGDRDPVYSAGVGLRMNLFGFAIIELDWVKPFSRPNKGSYLQFQFAPGF